MGTSATEYEVKHVAAIYGRIAEFLHYASEVGSLMGLVRQGMQSIIYSRELVDKASVQLAKNWEAQEEKNRQGFAAMGAQAQRAIDQDHPLLHSNSLMGLWGATEAAIEDIAALWIQAHPQVHELPVLQKMRVAIGPFLALDPPARARLLVREIQRVEASEMRVGVGQFESLLDAIGLGGGVDSETRRLLLDAQQLRHLIAHRAGVIDEQFLERCPSSGYAVGDAVKISSDQFWGLAGAMADYIDGIGERVDRANRADPALSRSDQVFGETETPQEVEGSPPADASH